MKFWFFATTFFALGTIVGSFLNVCIYRLPRHISLCNPSRSFCPICQSSLKWKELIPLFSWIALRKRCFQCHAPISRQYFLVELLTGTLFSLFWIFSGFPQALGLWVLSAVLIVGTFIDSETLIIPNTLNWGGMFLGIILSVAVPTSLGLDSASAGIGRALSGGIIGYLLLWGVLEIGKWLFGKARFQWSPPQKFYFFKKGGNIQFQCGEKIWHGEEIFVRKNDMLFIETGFWKTTHHREGKGSIRLQKDYFISTQGKMMLADTEEISGTAITAVIPREAMGWGDVKFLATIGTFIGGSGALFTLFSASLLGTLIGIYFLIRRYPTDAPIPFGPLLAIGALIWILEGENLWKIYLSHLGL